MSVGGSASGTRQTQNAQSGVDAETAARQQAIWGTAQAAGAAGPSPLATGAGNYNTGAMAAGNLGMGALSGDAAAAQQLMNPYQQQVIGATNAQWDQNDQHTMNEVNDRATQAGAFGGSRHGIATGTALAQNNMNRNSAVSGLLSSGYDNTMSRAAQLAQMGAGASDANANLGMGGVGSPEQWKLDQLRKGYMQQGTTSSGANAGVTAEAHGGFFV